jgi:hypothetical protein
MTSTATSITVATSTGALFPVLDTGDYFFATIQDTNSNLEIVKVTARAGDTMTILRGQYGTVAIPFASDSRIEVRVLAENMQDFIDGIDFLLL